MLRSLLLVGVLAVLGCGGSEPPLPSVEENVSRKVEAMTKLAAAAEGPNQEFAVKGALEDYRDIPFQAKTQPEAAKKILEIYNTRVKGKLKGDIAVVVAGEMKLLEKEMN